MIAQPATVLLLPGNMCDERMWASLDLCVPEADIVSPLLEGATIEEMARICLTAFPGPLLPIGFSMGGIVALAMAARAPERVIGLGLLDTNPFADAPDRAEQRPRQQEEARVHGVSELVAEELKPNYLADINRDNLELRCRIQVMAEELGPDVFVLQSEALRTRPSYDHVLEHIDVPVFVACGAQDRLCTPELHAAFAQRITQAQLHVIEGAGHMLPMEQPQALSDRLTPWLTETLARSKANT